MNDHSELDAIIAQIQSLETLPEKAAPTIAAAVERVLLEHVRAGVGPDGTPWAPTEAGNTPLQGAAGSLTVRAIRTKITCKLVGRHARHHLGYVKGGKARPILPTAGVPAPMAAAIKTALDAKFRELSGGR